MMSLLTQRRLQSAYTSFKSFFIITCALILWVSFYSPGEMSRYFGIGYQLFFILIYLGFMVLLAVLIIREVYSGKKIVAISAWSCVFVLILNFCLALAYPTASVNTVYEVERMWNLARGVVLGAECERDKCGDYKVLNREYWGGGLGGGECYDVLFFQREFGVERSFDNAYLYIRGEVPSDASGITIKVVGHGLYSAIACSM